MTELENLNIIILGSSEVGKTSIINRYFNNEYTDENIATIGIQHNHRFFKFNEDKVKIDYIDTAGQEKFKSIAANFLKRADGVILVFDVTQRDTFKLMDMWVEEINNKNNINNIGKILLGNKIDLENKREVKKEEGIKLGKSINCNYLEVSAKTGHNIKDAFDQISRLTYEACKLYRQRSNSFHLKGIQKKVEPEDIKRCC